MNLQRHVLLWGLVGFTVVLAGVLAWGRVYDLRTHFFAGGAPPPDAAAAAQLPTLPPLRTSDPSKGSSDPHALYVVEFGDYTCTDCRLTEPQLEQALAETPVPVHFVWRDLPVAEGHVEPIMAALAGQCAADQNKFWEMRDALFRQDRFDTASLTSLAQSLGLASATFHDCLMTGKHLRTIADDILEARQNHFTAAPTIFVGSQVLTGYVTTDDLLTAIRNAR